MTLLLINKNPKIEVPIYTKKANNVLISITIIANKTELRVRNNSLLVGKSEEKNKLIIIKELIIPAKDIFLLKF